MHTQALKELRDIQAGFFLLFLSLSESHFSSPSFDFRQGLNSNNRPVSAQTKLGSFSMHFQGAAAAVRERVRMEKEWGGCMHGVEGAEPDMTVEKQSGTREQITVG